MRILAISAALLALASCSGSRDVANEQIAKDRWNRTDDTTAELENVWEVESNVRIKRLEERTAELEAEIGEMKALQEARRLSESRVAAVPAPAADEAKKSEKLDQ